MHTKITKKQFHTQLDSEEYNSMQSFGEKFHMIKWLHNNRSEGCSKDAMDLAAKNGHLHVLKWLHENRKEGEAWEK